MTAAAKMITEYAANASDEHALVRKFGHSLYFRKAELVAVATELGLDATGTRSALCYRIARHVLA